MDALHAARPIIARLGSSSDKEDVAADIIEAWSAIESGLRSLVGGSTLAGQPLIRELRQRQLLTFEQANALAEFHAARERAGRVDYSPTAGDVSTVRDAFLKLEAGLLAPEAPRAPAAGQSTPVSPVTASIPLQPMSEGSTKPAWMWPVAAVLALVIVGGGAWFMFAGRGGASDTYNQGVAAYREGRREAAQGSFRKAAADAPADPMPHVYLARMEREAGNLSNANAEAVKAVQLGPENGTALRELASALFAEQKFESARTFYIRAIKADTTDRASEGFLGCSLVRLGRFEEGSRWIARAGTGAWSTCMPAPGAPAPATPNPAVPMTVNRP